MLQPGGVFGNREVVCVPCLFCGFYFKNGPMLQRKNKEGPGESVTELGAELTLIDDSTHKSINTLRNLFLKMKTKLHQAMRALHVPNEVAVPARKIRRDKLGDSTFQSIWTSTEPLRNVYHLFNGWPTGRVKLFQASNLTSRKVSPDCTCNRNRTKKLGATTNCLTLWYWIDLRKICLLCLLPLLQ